MMANMVLTGMPQTKKRLEWIGESGLAGRRGMVKSLLGLCVAVAALMAWGDYTESAERVLTQDETIAVDGVLTVSSTVNLAGHKLTYTGVTDIVGTGSITDESLPYVPVEYLRSDGQSWIDVGWRHTSDGYAVETVYKQLEEGAYPCLCGNNGSYLCFTKADSSVYVRVSGAWSSLGQTYMMNEWYWMKATVKYGAQSLSYGPDAESAVTTTNSYGTVNNNCPFVYNADWYVFAANCTYFKNNYPVQAQLKSMKIWSSAETQDTTTLVRDYIPVKLLVSMADAKGKECAAGTLGLWDLKNGRFYANAGTGAFTAPEVETPDYTRGELHLDVAANATCGNTGVAFTGALKFVKEGAGTYAPSKSGQTYLGGTEVKGGLMKAQNAFYPCQAADVITIDAGATLDINQTSPANGASAACLYVFNGGSMVNSGSVGLSWQNTYQGLGRVEVLVDSTINTAGKAFGFQNFRDKATSCELHGHTLTIDTGAGQVYFYNCTMTGGGKIKIDSTGSADLAIQNGLQALTTVFETQADLIPYNGIVDRVGGLVECRTNSTYTAQSGFLEILGVYTPVSDFINSFRLLNGATLDLSQRTTPFPLKSSLTKQSLVLVNGGTNTVNLAGRTCALGECLVEWTPETEPNVTFLLDETTLAAGVNLAKTAQGLFYGGDPNDRTIVKAFWTGAAGDGNLANPLNWDCRNLAEVTISGEDALPGADAKIYIDGAQVPQIPAGATLACAGITLSGALTADCDWRGLGTVMLRGSLDLAGHKLYVSDFAGDVSITDTTVSYEPLDYLTATGTQYIDAGWKHGSAGYTVEAEYLQTGEADYPCLCGNKGSYICFTKKDKNVYVRVGATWNTLGQAYELNKWCWLKASVKDGAQTLAYGANSETASVSTKSYGRGNNNPAYVFDANWYVFAAQCPGWASHYPLKAQIRRLKIWSSADVQDETTLVRDFVPARLLKDIPPERDSAGQPRTAGTLGLWDRVNGRFHANVGTGTFTGGAALPIEAAGELHIDVPEGQTVGIADVTLTGALTLVKEGEGVFAPTKTGQSYKGGTVVAAGTFKAQNTFYPSDAQSVVTIYTNATFDVNQTTASNGPSAACLYRLVGGTLANTGTAGVAMSQSGQGIGRLEVLAPSFIRSNNHDFGFTNFRNGATYCEMNGQTLTIDVGTGIFLFYKLTVTGGGKIVIDRASRVDLAINPGLQAPTTVFETTVDLIPWDKLDHQVWGVIERRTESTFNAQVDSHLTILGRYTPVTDFMNNFRLAAGATIDLSVRHEPLPLTSSLTGKLLELPAEGTLYVALGERTPAGNNCLIRWTEETAPSEDLTFVRDPTEPKTPVLLYRDTDGLYFRSDAFMLIVR